MTVTTKRSIIALLLSLVLVVSLFTVSISAATEAAGTGATETESETTASEKGTSAESATISAEEQAKIDATTTTLVINGIIIGVIVLIIAIVAIKFRKKLGAFLRSVKSELKKIVWTSKENTRKGFLVVAIVAVAFAILIGLMDYAFGIGISSLAELFKK